MTIIKVGYFQKNMGHIYRRDITPYGSFIRTKLEAHKAPFGDGEIIVI